MSSVRKFRVKGPCVSFRQILSKHLNKGILLYHETDLRFC